ncbi:hypothetical protein JEQ21_02950 [Streptococcus sp. 121]|uniref:hypothetical protein n=1 Tax=Streptococcus sp. 121 TaxID=2797637 RepID=UPI0018F0FE26|nr:hypothetical protein [Streptococcus sp. 121]MBJ6745431.1 hypothetical protein [Streptococcus sp. 121]
MELQEAKSIYHALRNDYSLFLGDKKTFWEFSEGEDLYTILGVYEDIKPYLTKPQVGSIKKVLEKYEDFQERWYALHSKVYDEKHEIESNKLLTRKQKEEALLSLREEVEKELTKLNDLSQKNQSEQFEVNSFAIEFLKSVEEVLKTKMPQKLAPRNLYELDTVSPMYKEQVLDRICPPFVPYEERNWGYYQSKGLDVRFVKFVDKLLKQTVGQFAEDWRQGQYAKQLGYTNATEWKAKKFEEYLEEEDLEQIKEVKKEMAFQRLQEEGGKEKAFGWFDKIINGWRPEEE